MALLAIGASAIACSGLLGLTDPALDDGLGDGGPGTDGAPLGDAAPTGDATTADGSTTCNADLTTDKANCGFCGHDCLGGDCKDSKCQPVLMVDNASVGPYGMLVQGDTLFYTNSYGDLSSFQSIDKMAVNNTPAFKTIATFDSDTEGYPYQLAAIGTDFYIALYGSPNASGGYTGSIAHCNASNCGPKGEMGISSYSIASDGVATAVWGALSANPDGGDDINRVEYTTNAFTQKKTLTTSGDPDDVVNSLALENGIAYFGAPSGVYYKPIDGGAGDQIASGLQAVQIAVHDGIVYFSTGGNVRSVKQTSTDPTQNVLIAGPFQNSSGIAVDDKFVYAVDEGDRNADDAGSL
ncbi:MAG TPA: hypothetical protein VF407_06840, partial [Polyangiaceae bacterium]